MLLVDHVFDLVPIVLLLIGAAALVVPLFYFTLRGVARTRDITTFTQQAGLIPIGTMDGDPDSLVAIEPAPGRSATSHDALRGGRLVWQRRGTATSLDAATVFAYAEQGRLTWVLPGTQISGRDQLSWFVVANPEVEAAGIEVLRSRDRRRLTVLALAVPVLLIIAALEYWRLASHG